jgi:hypothetical protein
VALQKPASQFKESAWPIQGVSLAEIHNKFIWNPNEAIHICFSISVMRETQ